MLSVTVTCVSSAVPGDQSLRLTHLARNARYASNIPGTQDEPLGFAVTSPAFRRLPCWSPAFRRLRRSHAPAAQLMDDILTPFQVDFNNPDKQ